MKKLMTVLLVVLLTTPVFAGEEAIKGGTIPGVASVGVDLLADKSAWKSVKEHFGNNWGKYLVGIITTGVGALVYTNNKGFHGESVPGSTVNTTTHLYDESISVNVSGNNSIVYVYSNRDSDNQ